MSYSDLKGKTFVVTGAASGMGRTTSILLAKQGANVALVDLRKPDNTQSFSNGVNDTHANGNITSSIAVACDARDRAAVEAALLQIVDHFGGPIHGAANMAGITGSGKEGVEALNDDDWDSVLGVNLDGVKNCLRAELKHMADGGAIVNAGSIAGQLAFPSMAPYCISKWGVLGLTKVAAQESGKRGIRVNAVAPYVPSMRKT
jgi:NAD(P)-dependent dehydrogenase (short-subunit alcohol dehydrogenase family)